MDDTISRQEAIVTAVRAAVDWHKLANPQYSIAYCIGEAMRQLPSAQPERKKGKWLRHPAYKQKDFCEWDVCSACGTGCHRREYGKNPDGTMYEDIYGYRFCPNCGAKMEAEG